MASDHFLGGFCKFFTAEADQYRTWKMFLGFPFGALMGYGLYHLVIVPMAFPEVTRQFLGAVLIFGIAAGFALFVGFRCVCFLLIPTFMGTAGRSYIGTFAITFLLAGPIENIMNNTQEITRSLTCSAELSANQTMAKWQFRMKPIGNVFKDMQAEGFMLKNIGTRVNRAFSTVRSEIQGNTDEAKMKAEMKAVNRKMDKLERDKKAGNGVKKQNKGHSQRRRKSPASSDDEGEKIEKKYKQKVENQCNDLKKAGHKKCVDVFSRLYTRCQQRFPAIAGWLCKCVDFSFLCDWFQKIFAKVTKPCDPNTIVPENFGKMYVNSVKSLRSMDEGFEVDIKYRVVEAKEAIDFTSAEEMRSRTMHDFKQGRKWVEFIFTLIKRVLGFTFLLVVYRAYQYYKRYVTDLRFDNLYITSYFKKIDARRRFKGQGTVLLLVRAALSGIVFFVAHALYTVLSIIRKHSRVDFTQKGVNHVDIKVEGTGFMSQIVRLFLSGLNTHSQLNEISSNLGCLPNPKTVERKYYVYVFGIYAAVLLLIIMDAYALRLRRVTASFFFRKREKQRILYMYNILMKKRICFLRDMRRKVKKRAKQMKLGKRSTLMYALGRVLPCMRLCKSARGKCLICVERENFSFFKCKTPRCNCVYCRECWEDIKEKCYACLPLPEFSSTDTDATDSSEDDEL